MTSAWSLTPSEIEKNDAHIASRLHWYTLLPGTQIISFDEPESDLTMTTLAVLTKILSDLPASAFENSYSFHDAMENALEKQGWIVTREFQVRNRGDGRVGYIDLAVMHPVRIGLELDRNSPRKNSLFKLGQFRGLRFVILRECRKIIPINEKESARSRAAEGCG